MAQQLYPPYIEGQLPAQVGDTLCIPYQLNRAIGPSDVTGKKIKARIKQVTTNTVVTELEFTFDNNSIDGSTYYANFNGAESFLQVGQYYKIQLAFKRSNYYSTGATYAKINGTTVYSKARVSASTQAFQQQKVALVVV